MNTDLAGTSPPLQPHTKSWRRLPAGTLADGDVGIAPPAALALHLITSVGWIGAAAGYLVLGVLAAMSEEPLTIRAAWIGMEVIGWHAVVPLGGLALLTGLVMSLGTHGAWCGTTGCCSRSC